jgi:ABC-type glycerol-3-phosphate transport system substrate-binding protein
MAIRRRQIILGAALSPLAAACATQSGPAEQAPAPSKVPVSVRYVHQWSALYIDRMDKIVADFTAKNPNVRAEHQRVPDVHAAFTTNQAAGSPADVHMLWRSNMPAIAMKNGIMDLGPLIRSEKFDSSVFYENEYKNSQFLGKTYVLPMAATGAWYIMFFNRDHLREAGLNDAKGPATWAEAARYAGALTRRGADGKIERLGFEPAVRDAGTFNSPFAAWLYTNEGKFVSDDGRKLLFDSPQGAATLEWMQNVVRQVGGPQAYDEFFERAKGGHDSFPVGQRAMYMTNHSFPARLQQVAKDLRYGIDFLPRGSDRGATGIVRGGWSNAIPTGVKAPYESWLLLRYLSAAKEGGGWFMQEQVRPSPIKAVNEDPAYNSLPHWDVIKRGLASDRLVPVSPMDPEIDKLTATMVTEVYQGKTPLKEALAFAQKEGQRILDEFWASVKA